VRQLRQRLTGFDARRRLPTWNRRPWREPRPDGNDGRPEVALFVDCFTRWFEPDNARAAARVLEAAGYAVVGATGSRAPCCGRTHLATGRLDAARSTARRLLASFAAPLAAGTPLVTLEPSCQFTLADDLGALLPAGETAALRQHTISLEAFLIREADAGRLNLPLRPINRRHALLHSHCHQKSYGDDTAVKRALALVPELDIDTLDAGCCGMAGAFGYGVDHYEQSLAIGECGPLPHVRAAGPDTLIVADGTSCRSQFADAAGRRAVHVACVLAASLGGSAADLV
jgi:Fe-S oxidoreductase